MHSHEVGDSARGSRPCDGNRTEPKCCAAKLNSNRILIRPLRYRCRIELNRYLEYLNMTVQTTALEIKAEFMSGKPMFEVVDPWDHSF